MVRMGTIGLGVAVLVLAAGGVVTGGTAAAAPPRAAAVPSASSVLGPDVYVFTPDMPQQQIQDTVDAVAAQQVPNQFGPQRYALLFEPGTYGSAADPLNFEVGYYTEVAGLGRSPRDVTINGSIDVYNQCFPTADGSSNCTALDNFWRSLSNLTIAVAGKSGCRANTEFWATSQAASLRRVNLTGGTISLMDYCSAGPQYASGGFIADSSFSGGTVVNGSQQQFLVRNSSLDGWSNGVWNQVFAGVDGAPPQSFGPGANPYTTLATTPVAQDRPYLYTRPDGSFAVLLPAVQRDSSGTTWANGPTPGRSVPLSRFLVADPSTPVQQIDRTLRSGKNLLLTPGVYHLDRPIHVTRAHTIVLGLGFPTLVPRHGSAAMHVASVPGVKLAGMIFDAGPRSSRTLLRLGDCSRCRHGSSPTDPTTVQDVYFRVGGATPGRAATALTVNSSDVVLDNIWAWRADHGAGVGWDDNVADTGVVVNGDDVTAYGLFVEHFEKQNVIWNGQHGTDVFFQNEMPYDVPSQVAWMSDRTTKGYPAFLISPRVHSFQGYGMGSYCFFNQGLDIHATEAFQAPRAPGVQLHDLLTVFLDGSGGIDSVVDGTGAPVTSAQQGQPSDVVDFP